MKMTKKWEILAKRTTENVKLKIEELIEILLENRGLKTKKEQDTFLHPDIASVTPASVGIDTKQQKKTIQRIDKAIENKEQIIVFGDYDVDGIAGTAILWETLNALGAVAMPYIPSRVDEGYGLSIRGIENIKHKTENLKNTSLIITVDNGIVANEAVDYANSLGIDVIITDHHVPSAILPSAYSIFHTTKLCGTGVAYMLARSIEHSAKSIEKKGNTTLSPSPLAQSHLALVALATVADLVPLQGANRIVLTEGLKILHTTKRPGIVALCEEAGIEQGKIGVYEIGHMLGPRINAMGRISHAMDSLRLLCTKDRLKAKVLAEKLGITNKDRQEITLSQSEKAISNFKFLSPSTPEVRKGSTTHTSGVSNLSARSSLSNLLFIADEEFDEGVIGLVAGKLVEYYYRPSIVVSLGKKISKASARSIAGFNVIEFIRKAEHLLINAGGHPMAAGFTVETEKVKALQEFLLQEISKELSEELLVRTLKIDCELPLEYVLQEVYNAIQTLQPFGMGNPEPTFLAKAKIISARQVGKDKNHLSMQVQPVNGNNSVIPAKAGIQETSGSTRPVSGMTFSAIAFGMGDQLNEFTTGKIIDIVYTIDEHEWNNKKSLQLKIKDIKN